MIQHEQYRRAVKVGRGRLTRGLCAVLFLFLAAVGSASASVRLIVQPDVMVADGRSTLTVTAEVRDSRGRIGRDGMPVRFVTTAGTITPLVSTSAGVARATLTSATAPTTAVVTAFAGPDQASARVQMVSDVSQATLDGRVLRMSGQYVAFSEALRYLDAVQDVVVRYRGLTVEADGLQIDLGSNELRAFGRVGIASGEKTLQGDRLWLNLTTFEGYLTSIDKKVWFSGYGLNELPEAPKGVYPSFEFKEVSKSTLTWVGKGAVFIPGVKVQVQGAKAYVGGIKALRMPYHEARLDGSAGDYGQYVGAGSQGLILDIPVFVAMSPGATTAVRFRDGDRAGFGYFNTRPGFGLDLEEKYGISNHSEGVATIDDVTNPDWGFRWNHTQQFGTTTRLDAVVETPAHRDLYTRVNVAQQFEQGNATVSLGASKLTDRAFGRSVDAGFQTTAEPLLNRNLFLSFGTRYTDIAGGEFQQAFNHRFDIQPTQVAELNMRLQPANWEILPKLNFSNNVTIRSLFGTTTGPALGYFSGLSYTLPANGTLNLTYNFDQHPTIQSVLTQAHHNLSATAAINPTPQLRASIYGNMGLDQVSRSLSGELSYRVTPSWRLNLLESFYQFSDVGHLDLQPGIARKVGERELVLYYSTERGQVLFEIGSSQF